MKRFEYAMSETRRPSRGRKRCPLVHARNARQQIVHFLFCTKDSIAIDSELKKEFRHPVERCLIDPTVIVKGRRCAIGITPLTSQVKAKIFSPSFGCEAIKPLLPQTGCVFVHRGKAA